MTTSLVIALSLAMIIPLTSNIARASAPPYTWAGPTDVQPHLGQDNLPAGVQAANGTLWMAWQTFRFSASRPDIVYSTLTNGAWSTVNRVTSTGINTTPTMAQLSNGTIILFWSQLLTNTFSLYY